MRASSGRALALYVNVVAPLARSQDTIFGTSSLHYIFWLRPHDGMQVYSRARELSGRAMIDDAYFEIRRGDASLLSGDNNYALESSESRAHVMSPLKLTTHDQNAHYHGGMLMDDEPTPRRDAATRRVRELIEAERHTDYWRPTATLLLNENSDRFSLSQLAAAQRQAIGGFSASGAADYGLNVRQGDYVWASFDRLTNVMKAYKNWLFEIGDAETPPFSELFRVQDNENRTFGVPLQYVDALSIYLEKANTNSVVLS
jgi:hypothetical protein